MQLKKMQVAPKLNGRPPLRESVATTLGARSGRRSFAAELRSIVAAAHLLPAEVARQGACGVPCACNSKRKASSGIWRKGD